MILSSSIALNFNYIGWSIRWYYFTSYYFQLFSFFYEKRNSRKYSTIQSVKRSFTPHVTYSCHCFSHIKMMKIECTGFELPLFFMELWNEDVCILSFALLVFMRSACRHVCFHRVVLVHSFHFIHLFSYSAACSWFLML